MQPVAEWEKVKFINTSAEFPYLYCALGFICAAIAFALFYRLQNSISVAEGFVEENKRHHQIRALDAEPKIVLVFAGNDKLPLFLANPTPFQQV